MRLIFEWEARIASPASSQVIDFCSRNRRSCEPRTIRNTVGPPRWEPNMALTAASPSGCDPIMCSPKDTGIGLVSHSQLLLQPPR